MAPRLPLPVTERKPDLSACQLVVEAMESDDEEEEEGGIGSRASAPYDEAST